MDKFTQQLLETDRQRVFHASTHLKQYAQGDLAGRIITHAHGIHIHDSPVSYTHLTLPTNREV